MKRRTFLKGSMLAGAGMMAANAPSSARAEKLNPPYPIPEGPVTLEEYRKLKEMTEKVYEFNRVTMSIGTFHVPSHGKYSSLFGWDSGWHAITMSRIDPKIAASEIECLFSLQEENGRVSHDTHFAELETRSTWYSKLGTAVGGSQFDEQGRSAMIDPPSYIIAAEKIYETGKDQGFLERMLPKLEKVIHYLTTQRDLFDDGLIAVIHPWETGTDSSPSYDKILHLDFRTPLGAPTRMLLYPSMINYNSRFDWDPQIAKKKNRFVLQDVCFNAIAMRGIQGTANLFEAAGDKGKAEELRAKAKAMMASLDNNNWMEDKGLYNHRYDAKDPKLCDRTTCSSLLPLLTGLVSPDRAERMFKQHVMNPERFWTDYLFPYNPRDEMKGDKVYYEDLLLWRGHCIWTNMNWMMNEAFLAYGMADEARELTRRTAKMILHEGLWEFYDFRNGQGKGQPHFNWPGLVLDMIHRSWPEAAEA